MGIFTNLIGKYRKIAELNRVQRNYQEKQITVKAEVAEVEANLKRAQQEWQQAQIELRSSRANLQSTAAAHAMTITIAIPNQDDIDILKNIDPDVFDDAIDIPRAIEFLADPRHHLVVAIDNNLVIGFVCAVHYVHPDKPLPELWINEIGVAATHQRQGIGKRLMNRVLELGRELGCEVAWVLTDLDNTAAMSLYASVSNSAEPTNHVMFSFDLEKSNP